MNKFIFAIAMVFPLTYCLLASAGGSDAGGGGAVQEPNASAQDILHGVATSKVSVLMWLNQQEYQFRSAVALNPSVKDQFPEFTKIFLGTTTIFDIIPKVTIQLRLQEPCYNKYGQPWDGSIYPRDTDQPYTLCISSFNLQKKLTHDDYDFETAALVLHEISHFLGTTEDEAIRLQASCQEDIVKFELSATWNSINQIRVKYGEVLDLLQSKPTQAEGSQAYVWKLFRTISGMSPYLALEGVSDSGPLSLLRARERDELAAAFVKLAAPELFACIHDPLSTNQTRCSTDENKLFAGTDLVKTSVLRDYEKLFLLEDSDHNPEIDPEIKRVKNFADYYRTIDEVSDDLKTYFWRIDKFTELATFQFPIIEK